MSDAGFFFNQWLHSTGKKGSFITNEEGRVIFIGGPGSGGGTAGGVSVQAGITSARPEKQDIAQLTADMQELEDALKNTTATNVKVQLGTGGWEGGAEPTFITTYEGNGQALAVLANYGKQWNQDGVLVMASGGDQPQSWLSIKQAVDPALRASIEQALVSNGIGGWTWGRRGTDTLLMATNVPQWGGNAVQHRSGIQNVLAQLKEAGLSIDFKEQLVEVVTMDSSNYDNFTL